MYIKIIAVQPCFSINRLTDSFSKIVNVKTFTANQFRPTTFEQTPTVPKIFYKIFKNLYF